MYIRQLMIFVKVYEQQSITKAALLLNMAQPAVSLAIKELEEQFHTSLFDRMNRRIYPTQQADKLYAYAIHVISLLSEIEEKMEENTSEGKLRIGSSVTIGNYVLPFIVRKIKDDYPQVDIKVYVHNVQTIEAMLLANQLDIALIETDPVDKNIVKETFMKDSLVTIVGSNHPLLKKKRITLTQLTQYPFLFREEGSSVTKLVKGVLMSRQMLYKQGMESTSTTAIIHHVQAGLGVAILPYMMVHSSIDEGIVCAVEIEDFKIERNYHVIYHKNKYLSRLMLEFIQKCHEFRK